MIYHAAFVIIQVLFGITSILLHKEIMLLIQIITSIIQTFAKTIIG